MSDDAPGRPREPILTDATVIVVNRNVSPEDGQGMIAISPRGCLYLDDSLICVKAISLDELETFIKAKRIEQAADESAIKITDIILATIETCRHGGKTQ